MGRYLLLSSDDVSIYITAFDKLSTQVVFGFYIVGYLKSLDHLKEFLLVDFSYLVKTILYTKFSVLPAMEFNATYSPYAKSLSPA